MRGIAIFTASLCLVAAASSMTRANAQAADPQTVEYQRQTARFQAEKAAIDAQVAAALAMANSIPNQTLGAVQMTGENAGLPQARILSASQIQYAASLIATRVASAAPRNIVVLTGTNRADFALRSVYREKKQTVDRAYARAQAQYDSIKDQVDAILHPPHANPERLRALDRALDSAALGFAGDLSILSRLGSFFQRDINVSGADMPGDDDMLAIATASSLHSETQHVFLRSDWASDASYAKVEADLSALDQSALIASRNLAALNFAEAALRARQAAAPDAQKPQFAAMIADFERVNTTITAALTAHETLAVWLGDPPSAGASPRLPALIQQIALYDALHNAPGTAVPPLADSDQANLLLIVHVVSGARGTMTERSLWTFLGYPPVYTSASVVITMQTINPISGETLDAAIIACSSGYVRLGRVHHRFQENESNHVPEGLGGLATCRILHH